MSRKYKTWEVIKMLNENRRLKFKKVNVNEVTLENRDGLVRFYDSRTYLPCYGFWSDDEWELMQEPISFEEAIKKLEKGIDVVCEIEYKGNICKYTYSRNTSTICGFGVLLRPQDECGTYSSVTTQEILNGKWYIKQD